jgi:FkbM family methyltransferase
MIYEKGRWNVFVATNLYRCYRVWLRAKIGKQRRDKFLEDTHINIGDFLLLERPIKVKDGIMGVPRRHTQDFNMLFYRPEKKIEPEITDLRKGESFVDVGANIGYYTLRMASVCAQKGDYPTSTIISIEPDPENYRALCQNIACNGFTNIITINKAAWDSRGFQEMRVPAAGKRILTDYPSICFEYEGTAKSFKKLVVEADTLDNMLNENNVHNIGILKMDIEGAEVHALKGAKDTAEKVRKIVVEVHGNANKEKVKSILINYGFNIRMLTIVRKYEYPFVIGEKSK